MLDTEQRPFIAFAANADITLIPKMANRHGLITGATGTGKTVTLQTMAETFSQLGVPVFAADVKGDLSGVAAPGGNKESVMKRVSEYGLAEKGFAIQSFPVEFWDVFGESGAPVRATVQDMGPLLLSRLLNLNDTQSAVLTVVFKIATDEQLEIIDMKDLRRILEYAGANSKQYTARYGNISTASIGAIQRGLIALEHDGVDKFFGEPNLNIDDLIQTRDGKGVINILASDKLMNSPKTYSTFLLWLMSKLFEVLPEVGDPEKPKLVFFFDEAHLLFSDAPKALLEKIEQTVRLIRSKGVGIYFISQTPSDLPDSVLGQLGNRVQHALRAYTPKDQKALKAAAASFRANPGFDTETAISELGTGEALVSFLDAKGAPQPVQRAFIAPPQSQIGPLDAEQRAQMLEASMVNRFYSKTEDRRSAYEALNERLEGASSEQELTERKKAEEKARQEAEKEAEKQRKAEEKARITQEKAEQKRAAEQRKFWGKIAQTVVKDGFSLLLKVLGRR
ncbi:DUF853 domain-containing protein [Desulfovibrio sp. OttesenSCG-928-C06]|nr:DUF853 domain-containing protein [Desulfovibrio sp. OttesenSCG-928-C06]